MMIMKSLTIFTPDKLYFRSNMCYSIQVLILMLCCWLQQVRCEDSVPASRSPPTDSTTAGATLKSNSGDTRAPVLPDVCRYNPEFCGPEFIDVSPIRDYDRAHPLNVTATGIGLTFLNVSWALPGVMNETDLLNYRVHYMKRKHIANSNYHKSFLVPANTTTAQLTQLETGTKYSFYIRANYSTGHKPASSILSYITQGYGVDRGCPVECNLVGSVKDGPMLCDRNTGECICKDNNTIGRTCDQCSLDFFWHKRIGCEACSCNYENAIGSCHADEGVKTCNCVTEYAGARCNSCANGFYLKAGSCVACACNGNIPANSTLTCDPESGECLGCGFNTTGFACELCLPGYFGEPIVAKNCTMPVTVLVHVKTAHKVTVVMIVCVSLTAFLALLVCFVIYKRCWGRKPSLQFWTIQLRDDHEQVNFAALADQPDTTQYFDRNASATHDDKSPQLRLKAGAYQVLEDGSGEAWVA